MKTVVHVNQHVIRANRKTGSVSPPIIARTYKGVVYGNHFQVVDENGRILVDIRYTPAKPLSCGATCYLTTDLEVRNAEA